MTTCFVRCIWAGGHTCKTLNHMQKKVFHSGTSEMVSSRERHRLDSSIPILPKWHISFLFLLKYLDCLTGGTWIALLFLFPMIKVALLSVFSQLKKIVLQMLFCWSVCPSTVSSNLLTLLTYPLQSGCFNPVFVRVFNMPAVQSAHSCLGRHQSEWSVMLVKP